MIVFIEDSFDSAHWLPNVPTSHKCHSMHGHTYRIRIEIEGKVNKKSGWIMDYSEIKKAWEPVKSRLDHKVLNEIKGLENSTCENLVEWVGKRLFVAGIPVSLIEIRETANCGAIQHFALDNGAFVSK